MGSWLQGLWSVLSAVLGMMLDVAQFWEQVSDPLVVVGNYLRERPATEPKSQGD